MKKFTLLCIAALASMFSAQEASAELVVTNSWTPEAPMAITKDWSTILEIPASPFKNSVAEKSVLRFHFSDLSATPQIQIAYKADDASWTWTGINDYTDIPGATLDYELAYALEDDGDVTDLDECIAGIKAHGLYLKGQGFTLTGIDILNPEGEGPKDPMEGYILSSTTTLDPALVQTSWKEVPVGTAPFKLLTEKSRVKMIFTDCGANPQVQVNYKSGDGWTWTSLNDFADIEDNAYMFSMSEFQDPADAAEWIKARGVILKGQNWTLTTIEVYNPEGDAPVDPLDGYVLSSSYTLDPALVQTSWKELVVPSAAFKNLIDKSAIRLVFSEIGENPQIQVNYKADDASWTWTSMHQYADLSDKEYVFMVAAFADPADALAGIKAHGLWLKGQNYTLTTVEVLNPEGEGPEPKPEMEVTGSETFDPALVMDKAWNTILEVPASAFATVSVKSDIILSFVDCGNNAQAQIVYKADDANWTWTEYAPYTDIEGGKIEIAVETFADPEDAVAGLKAHGMFLKGQNFSLAKVEVLNPKADGVANVALDNATIDWSAPVEVYNLQGMRVNEMTDGAIYIVRQNNVVVKIVK